MIDAALKLLPTLPRVCMWDALCRAIAAAPQVPEAGDAPWRCVNGYSDCWGPCSGKKVCPDCQYLTPQPEARELPEPVCVAIYDAVCRSAITRDVKTPERKAAIVNAALGVRNAK
jgi:hypothetical protein